MDRYTAQVHSMIADAMCDLGAASREADQGTIAGAIKARMNTIANDLGSLLLMIEKADRARTANQAAWDGLRDRADSITKITCVRVAQRVAHARAVYGTDEWFDLAITAYCDAQASGRYARPHRESAPQSA